MPNDIAKILRSNMTNAERRLWKHIRNRQLNGYKFKRQFPVWPYILDFACDDLHLAIEIDGGQHCENIADQKRTEWLAKQGWHIIRFWNNEVLSQTDSVLATILEKLINMDNARQVKAPLPRGEVA